VMWLWHGGSGVPTSRSLISVDPFDQHPSNDLQLNPTPYFRNFVLTLLRQTRITYADLMVALLYIWRLQPPQSLVPAGTETRPFLVSLILSNKYLQEYVHVSGLID
jgi:hypothetical protein